MLQRSPLYISCFARPSFLSSQLGTGVLKRKRDGNRYGNNYSFCKQERKCIWQDCDTDKLSSLSKRSANTLTLTRLRNWLGGPPLKVQFFFFPSCASVALARSSHIVVLSERITQVHTLYPSLGFESEARTTQSEVLSAHTKKQTTKTTKQANHKKHKQKTTKAQRKNWQDGSNQLQHPVPAN